MSKSISIFVSYSHINQKSAIQLIELLSEQLKASKNYDYHIWFDKQLNVGEVWKTKQPPAKAGGLAITTKVGIRVKDPFKSLF